MTTAGRRRERQIWVNGELVPWDSASVHLLSHAVQRGSMVFDAMSLYSTARGIAVFRLPDHVSRLRTSCEHIGLGLALDDSQIAAAVCEIVRANPGATTVKISAYLASLELDVVPVDTRVSLAIAAYDSQSDIKAYSPSTAPSKSGPLRVRMDEVRRGSGIIPPQAKVAANYLPAMIAKARAQQAGYDDVLFLDDQGSLLEGSNSNVFIIVDSGRVLRTPPADQVLLGMTRSSVIDLARSEGLAVLEEPITPQELLEAEEVFLTGTSKGLHSVESVNDRKIGHGQVGMVTKRLNDRLYRARRGEDPAFVHWLTLIDAM